MLLEPQFEFRSMSTANLYQDGDVLLLTFDSMESVFELQVTCDSNNSNCHHNDFSMYKFHT